MSLYLTKPINISLDNKNPIAKICKATGLKSTEVKSVTLHKQSVDARNKNDLHFVCSFVIDTTKTPKNATPYAYPTDVFDTDKPQVDGSCIVVGSGPAGLFLALYLVQSGVKVTVIERGSDVEKRKQAIDTFFNGGAFNHNTNVQFGLGGAGTFSDGKLTTGISSPFTYSVFREFVKNGAPQNIMYDALPHIGTDKLQIVVANLRDKITSLGGKFLFDTTVCDLVMDGQKVVGVTMQNGEILTADVVALAVGHSARDMFHTLVKHNANLQFKPFAVGLRIEHPRDFINTAQYGNVYATHRDFPSASYKLAHQVTSTHSCYSFCMCPGGVVVAANSELNSVVVNGMSYFARNERNSNSALVVNVTQQDVETYGFGNDVLAGVRFQQHLEELAYKMGGGNYNAPAQNVTDFVANQLSTELQLDPSYPRGTTLANLRNLLPKQIGDVLADALLHFDKKIAGFGTSGVLTGIESRTSSPVKILRDETMQSNLQNLYPVGEGAGYAGGIVSSAVDGIRVAQAIVQRFVNK